MSNIIRKYEAIQTPEGGGFMVARVFGHDETEAFDPFLMLDYLKSDGGDNLPGFPWHPHRGIETISYFIKGQAQHEDSMGNKGELRSGEVQWMRAGKGIFHQELLIGESRHGIQGFQFWVNMPAQDKLSEPRYKYIHQGEMKTYVEDGLEVKLIAGSYKDVIGAIDTSDLGINLFHIRLEPNRAMTLNRHEEKQGYVFLFEGTGIINGETIESVASYTLSAGEITIEAKGEKIEFIYAEGRPLEEPIAWRGPIVMNTSDELVEAFEQLDKDEFL